MGSSLKKGFLCFIFILLAFSLISRIHWIQDLVKKWKNTTYVALRLCGSLWHNMFVFLFVWLFFFFMVVVVVILGLICRLPTCQAGTLPLEQCLQPFLFWYSGGRDLLFIQTGLEQPSSHFSLHCNLGWVELWLRCGLANFFLGLACNSDLPDLSLSSS
jgi:hypothetical protein